MFVLALALSLFGCTTKDGEPVPVPGVDGDEDGYVSEDDCNDNDAAISPDAEEQCDGVDNNCDGAVDEDGDLAGAWYADTDGDGYGDLNAGVIACDAPAGTVADSTDCDDTEAARFPDNPEVCDGLDNDCDDRVDEGASDIVLSFEDLDQDGYGNSDVDNIGCTVPDGWVLEDGDCDEADATINPGAADVCDDGIDQDCAGGDATIGTSYADLDEDGYGDPDASAYGCPDPGWVLEPGDCDEGDALIHPGAFDVCDDGVDQDCTDGDAVCEGGS